MDFDHEAYGLRPSQPAKPGDGRTLTIPDALHEAARRWPNNPALVGASGRLTYAALRDVVLQTAARMQAVGIGRYDRVAASLANDIPIVAAFLATMQIGAIWVGIPTVLAMPEKRFMLAHSGSRLFITDPEMAAAVGTARAELPALREIWTETSLDAEARPAPAVVRIDPFAPSVFAYTSGTTGVPKAAVHSQYNMLLPGHIAMNIGALQADDVIAAVLPLTIANIMVLCAASAIQAGVKLICIDRPDSQTLARWIETEGVSIMSGVPTIYYDILQREDIGNSLSRLRLPETGGAEMPERLRRAFRDRVGRELLIGYGMTEAPTRVTWTFGVDSPPSGSCGRACAQVEIQIRDGDGRVLPAGEVGEICVSSRRSGPFAGLYAPFLGYWNDAEATAEVLRDGVLHTSDLGSVDVEGNVFIRGRKKELILRGGGNIYPAEIERVLMTDLRLAGCAVVGEPDERLGQRVIAYVQSKPDATIDEEELRALCEQNLARYKVPSEFRVIGELPRNAMGKVVKARLPAPT